MTRFRLAIVAGVLVVLLGALLWHRGAERQARLCFARLSTAVAAGDASGVVAQTHRDYDLAAHWPAIGEFAVREPRLVARQALAWLFAARGDDRLELVVDLHDLTVGDDGRVTALVSLHLAGGEQPLPFALGPILRHRFVLARDGLTAMRIIDHDPIAFSR